MIIDYVERLKLIIKEREYTIEHLRKVGDKVDEEFCCRHYGLSTYLLGRKIGHPSSTHRHALKKLEKQGKVISYKQQENQILWWPVGLLAEILLTNNS